MTSPSHKRLDNKKDLCNRSFGFHRLIFSRFFTLILSQSQRRSAWCNCTHLHLQNPAPGFSLQLHRPRSSSDHNHPANTLRDGVGVFKPTELGMVFQCENFLTGPAQLEHVLKPVHVLNPFPGKSAENSAGGSLLTYLKAQAVAWPAVLYSWGETQ